LWTAGRRLLEVGCGLPPFALTALNRCNRHVHVWGIWQTSFRNRKFVQRFLIIALAIVIIKTEREVRLRQVWLQANGRVGRRTRLFLSRGSWIGGVIHPIVDPCQSGKRSCKVRVESRRLLKKLLGLFNSGAKFVRTRAQIVSLDKGQV